MPSRKPTRRAGSQGAAKKGMARKAAAGEGASARAPRPTRWRGEAPEAAERGPVGWLASIRESTYMRLTPEPVVAVAAGPAAAGAAFASRLRPGADERVLHVARRTHWVDQLAEYKRRKVGAAATDALRAATMGAMAPGPVVPERNWTPLGPSVVLHGQAAGEPPVAGRVSGIAVAPGGNRIYAASANGGVFRSDDGGMSWRALMDAFDLDPTQFATTSLACGAIAIDPRDPNRVYVGTGEGDTYALFNQRLSGALPAYRGIGPIRSDDGGTTWRSEPTAPDSPSLAGAAFFALAVDPTNRERVLGATTEGLYERVAGAGSAVAWRRRVEGVFSSVVAVAEAGVTRFLAAGWGVGVLQSANGADWAPLGQGFPADPGRIAVAVSRADPGVVFAAVTAGNGTLLGLYRLDAGGRWKSVGNLPAVLPVQNGRSQGAYDLAVAVDPIDTRIVYLSGSYAGLGASVWRCEIEPAGGDAATTFAAARLTSIGEQAHADVHVLVHTPDDRDALWVGCDGGVFLNRAPRTTGTFQARNSGLACLCPTYFAQHPTDPGVLFCGLQDNGTARTAGGPTWTHVNGGDGGYCLINWADPQQVLVFANGNVYRATDGGQGHGSWRGWRFPWAIMTEPIVSPPYNPGSPAEASRVALGAGQWVYVSRDFAASWEPATLAVPLGAGDGIYSMVFATPTRVFVGTTTGKVYRGDETAAGWTVARVDDAAAGPLALPGIVADISTDCEDPTGQSIYIAFAGMGDRRRVWHFDGTRWEARSGAPDSGTDLLDVEHNAIVVDPAAPANLYVGADIGVWHSPDRGLTWQPLSNGLPDAPVFDLQIHPTRRLLRASTHGRGLYELPLD